MENSIEALHANDVFSGEAYLFCIDNHLQSIDELAKFMGEDDIVCSKRVRTEIEKVLNDYSYSHNELATDDSSSSEHCGELYSNLKNSCSVRAQNALNRLESDLGYPSQAFWNFLIFNPDKHSDFLRLRNVGRTTVCELLEIADRLIVLPNSSNVSDVLGISIPAEPETPESQMSKLSDRELELYKFAIEQEMEQLSVRSKNALDKLLFEQGNSIVAFYQLLHNNDFNPLKIKNVGRKSIEEILTFIATMDNLLSEYLSDEGKQKSAQLFRTNALQHRFGLTEQEAQVIIEDLPDTSSFPLFKAIDVRIKRYYRNWAIIEGTINIFRGQNIVDRKIVAHKLNLTPERVRQLRNKAYAEIVEMINQWGNVGNEDLEAYLDYCELEYNDQRLDQLCGSEKVNFNVNFIYRVLSLIYPQKYTLIGDDLTAFMEPYNKGGNLNIAPIELSRVFDFDKMIDDFRSRLNAKVYEDYSIELNEYLLGFFRDDIFFDRLFELSEICGKIIYRNFGIVATDGYLKIVKNATKNIPDIIEDILAENGKAMSLEEIFDQFESRHPGLTKDKTALRGSIIRNTNIAPVGRSSNYVLKAWDKIGIKGGTIRDIVFYFLMESKRPLSMDEIADHVLQYREGTNAQSIYYNLFADNTKRFSVFDFEGKKLIGLTHINYGAVYELIEGETSDTRRDFNESILMLEQFILDNNRFPFSSSENADEMRLNRFWELHKSRRDRGELNDEQLAVMSRIEEAYGEKEITKLDFLWNQKYENLLMFMASNNRPPARSTEYELYNWLYNQKAMIADGKLNLDQVQKIMRLNDEKF